MNESSQSDMSGHSVCLLCECWNATHHSRFVTTPMQPAEAEMMMIRGFRVALQKGTRFQGPELCERHTAVLSVLDEMEKPAVQALPETPMPIREVQQAAPLPPQPIFGQPGSIPCPRCGAAIGALCKTDDGFGFHKVRVDAASPETGGKVEGPGDVTPGPQ